LLGSGPWHEKLKVSGGWFFLSKAVGPCGSVSKPCTPVVHIKIAGKWMFIPLKMVLIGIDPYPCQNWEKSILTVDGRNLAPVDRRLIQLVTGFQPSKVMQDFFHPQ